MLTNAREYVDQLATLLTRTWYDDKYKFYHDSWHEKVEVEKSDWNKRQFVSLDKKGNVLRYIGYSIDRDADYISNFWIINFSDNKVIFGRDVAQAFEDIFIKYNFRKITFSVTIGNPIEKSYDSLMKKYGGRIVGTYKEHVKLIDNKLYDSKVYEIFRKDFIANYKKE